MNINSVSSTGTIQTTSGSSSIDAQISQLKVSQTEIEQELSKKSISISDKQAKGHLYLFPFGYIRLQMRIAASKW